MSSKPPPYPDICGLEHLSDGAKYTIQISLFGRRTCGPHMSIRFELKHVNITKSQWKIYLYLMLTKRNIKIETWVGLKAGVYIWIMAAIDIIQQRYHYAIVKDSWNGNGYIVCDFHLNVSNIVTPCYTMSMFSEMSILVPDFWCTH